MHSFVLEVTPSTCARISPRALWKYRGRQASRYVEGELRQPFIVVSSTDIV